MNFTSLDTKLSQGKVLKPRQIVMWITTTNQLLSLSVKETPQKLSSLIRKYSRWINSEFYTTETGSYFVFNHGKGNLQTNY
jgi:hypothetical protein